MPVKTDLICLRRRTAVQDSTGMAGAAGWKANIVRTHQAADALNFAESIAYIAIGEDIHRSRGTVFSGLHKIHVFLSNQNLIPESCWIWNR
jgi:hypothetical protein